MSRTRPSGRVQNRKPGDKGGLELSRSPAASSPGGSMSMAQLVRLANRWRDNFNPLRGLGISKVVSLIEAGERGDFAELEITNRKIEKRYPTLKALRSNRLAAITRLDYDIKIPDGLTGADLTLAKKQQAFLKERYGLISNFKEALRFLALAEFRGFAHLQKHYFEGGANDGAVKELHWLPQWNWVREGWYGDWFYNARGTFGATPEGLGESVRVSEDENAELRRTDFVIRECDAPLYEVALIAFVNWSMGRKDYAAFTEIFGLPNAVVIMPPNIPVDKATEFRDAATSVAEGASGALPNGASVEFPTSSFRNNGPFKEFCDTQDEDVILAGTGGKLTMLTESGSGTLAGGAHQETFDRLAEGEGSEISEVLQRDFDNVELDLAFPKQPHFAYFELYCKTARDAKTLVTNIVALEGAGLETDVQEDSEKLGMKLTRVQVAAAPTPPPGNPAEPDPALQDQTQNRRRRVRNSAPETKFFTALADDLKPLRERLQRILAIDDDQIFETKLREFQADIESLKSSVTADPAAARALAQINAAALAAGVAGKTP